MNETILELEKVIRSAILDIAPPRRSGRPSSKDVYEALKKAKPVIKKRFGSPVRCRYSGCHPKKKQGYSQSNYTFKVLEYLWDFSFSRYSVPQAIEDPRADPIENGKYELLFVAESEMGTKNEICRDLLKLLEAQTSIHCLVYRQPKRKQERHDFEARIIRVLHNHSYFKRCPGIWLFVALTWTPHKIECDLYTLDEKLNKLIPVSTIQPIN